MKKKDTIKEITKDIKETKDAVQDLLTPKKKGPVREAYLWVRRNRPLFYGAIAIVAIIVILFGTKIYLYTNFVLGNDIVLKFSTEKENLRIIRGEDKNISFEAKITTNLFCDAKCEATFEDVSLGKVLEKENITLTPSTPYMLNYNIRVDDYGRGQKLYRSSVRCHANPTSLCHTSGLETYRTILITADYELCDKDEKLKTELKTALTELQNNILDSKARLNTSSMIISSLDNNLVLNELKIGKTRVENELEENVNEMNRLKVIWDLENYQLLNEEVRRVAPKVEAVLRESELIYDNSKNSLDRYNDLLITLNATENVIDELTRTSTTDESVMQEINITIRQYNDVILLFNKKDALESKEAQVKIISEYVMTKYYIISEGIYEELIIKAVSNQLEYDVLCRLGETCVLNETINDLSQKNVFELNKLCEDTINLNNLYQSIIISNDTKNKQNNNTPNANETLNALMSLKQYIVDEYLTQLSPDKVNSDLMQEFLISKNFSKTPNLPSEIMIPFIVDTLANSKINECNIMSINTIKAEFNNTLKEIPQAIAQTAFIEFTEVPLKCCVFGVCDACNNNPDNYPIVFLHGHAFNKGTEAEYSLDAFNSIQQKLEDDGYLNAGVISLYTPPDARTGVWQDINAPVSIKATYYMDIFQEPQNYIVVQTKSENIDTYSIRLNDIIKTIKYKTGKDKVIIISHSMGGLVARRYIQVFGTDSVSKLIMIGTPNLGIKGSVASYCSVIGEQLECNDMKDDSLFINKVNRNIIPETIKVYTIIGTGCKMNGDDGDGIVVKENAALSYAENHYVNGTCGGIDTLHTDMLNINKYPQVYDIIRDALKT